MELTNKANPIKQFNRAQRTNKMAIDCQTLRNDLARETPIFKDAFLDDFISDMVNVPYVGRHQTEVWDYETDRVYFDKVHVMQPNYLTDWQTIDTSECGTDPCNPPSAFIGWGTTRDSAVMEQIKLRSKVFCSVQLAGVPKVQKQVAQILKNVRQIPIGFTGDFVRTRTVSYNDTLQICGKAFSTFAITTGNTATNLKTINLGSTANLPTSQLTWQYLKYKGQELGLKGYDKMSGMGAGMRNIITHSLTWNTLVEQNPEIKSMLHLVGVKDVSPLYKLESGINADPFGNFAPTFDEHQPRFQHAGNGLLQRVLPYLNSPATTGEKPIVNPSWLDAQYAISVINHPQAALVYTGKPTKINELIPTVNSSMWGDWSFVNNQGILKGYNPDGTTCEYNNETQQYFYWLIQLRLGFEYDQRELNMPILHLIDGSGKNCMVDEPVCGTVQYQYQDYSGDPDYCQA